MIEGVLHAPSGADLPKMSASTSASVALGVSPSSARVRRAFLASSSSAVASSALHSASRTDADADSSIRPVSSSRCTRTASFDVPTDHPAGAHRAPEPPVGWSHAPPTPPPAPRRRADRAGRAARWAVPVGCRAVQPDRRRPAHADRPDVGGAAPARDDRRLRVAAPDPAAHRAARRDGRRLRGPDHAGQSRHRPHVHGPGVRGRPVRHRRGRPAHPLDHRAAHSGRRGRAVCRLADPAGAVHRRGGRTCDAGAGGDRLGRAESSRHRRRGAAARRTDRPARGDGPHPGRHRLGVPPLEEGPDGNEVARHGHQPPLRDRHSLHGRALPRRPEDLAGHPRRHPREQRRGAVGDAPADRHPAGC